MYGIVVKGLKDYVVREYDWPTWRAIQGRADVERRLYTPVALYPDRHWVELADATRTLTGVDEEELAFGVGRHLAPTLLQVFGDHVGIVDSGLDVLADAESMVAAAIRCERLPELGPPDVAGERVDEEMVRLRYAGDYCAGFRGVVVGFGEQFGETYVVTERTCAGEERTCAGEGGGDDACGVDGEGEREAGKGERDAGEYCEFDVRRSPGTSRDGGPRATTDARRRR